MATNLRKFLLKKFPTNKYFDCPVSNEQQELMQEFCDQETKELKQQLTEANALIEKMGRALNHCKKQASEIECGCDDYNGFTCGLHAWKEDLDYSIEQYNEYKAKQTTQEVKP